MFNSVKDDGNVRDVVSTGAERERAVGKGRFDLISPVALMRLAKHCENGAAKYAPRNWERGLPLSRFIDSAFRHLVQFMDGARDEDHLAAVLWNIAGYIQTEEWIRRGQLPAALNDVPWTESAAITEKEEPNAVAGRDGKRVGKKGC